MKTEESVNRFPRSHLIVVMAVVAAGALAGCNDDKTSQRTPPPPATADIINHLPVASIDGPASVEVDDTVTLDASASADADDDALAFSWSQAPSVADVALVDADTATARFVVPASAAGRTLEFHVDVSDGKSISRQSIMISVSAALPDETPPDLAVYFPPPHSLTDVPLPGVLRFRGTVSDASGVETVTVNDTPATVNTDGTWSFDYSVLAGDNTVTVIATDEVGNETRETRVISHVADRAGVEFGTGFTAINPKAALWDAGRQRLLGGDVASMFEIELASGNRTFLSTAGGERMVHDTVGDRYLSADYGGAAGMEVLVTDPETGADMSISRRGDGLGQDAHFRLPQGLALTPDGRRLFARVGNDTSAASHLWVIDVDPESAQFGTRQQFSDESFINLGGLGLDTNRNRVLIGNCDLNAVSVDAVPGTASAVVVPEAGDFCINEMAIAGDMAWGRSRVAGANVIMAIDLATGAYAPVSDLEDPTLGPTVRLNRQQPGIDAERGIYYLYYDGALDVPDALFAIDLHSGYRVIVSQGP